MALEGIRGNIPEALMNTAWGRSPKAVGIPDIHVPYKLRHGLTIRNILSAIFQVACIIY